MNVLLLLVACMPVTRPVETRVVRGYYPSEPRVGNVVKYVGKDTAFTYMQVVEISRGFYRGSQGQITGIDEAGNYTVSLYNGPKLRSVPASGIKAVKRCDCGAAACQPAPC